jgi:hypothetical protein
LNPSPSVILSKAKNPTIHPLRFFGRGVHPELDPSVASLPQDDKGKKDSLKIKGEGLLQNDKKRMTYSEGSMVIANIAVTIRGHGYMLFFPEQAAEILRMNSASLSVP